MNNYSEKKAAKDWISNKLNETYGEAIKIGSWCNPNEWNNSNDFIEDHFGLEVYKENVRKILKFSGDDLDDLLAAPDIQKRIIININDQLKE